MNYYIPYLPERTKKPRKEGLTMVIDKGLSVGRAEQVVSAAGPYIDFVKLGFGSSYCTLGLIEKIRLFKRNNIQVFFGGTLFEAFLIRDVIEDYINLCREFELEYVEISDGSISIPLDFKCEMIAEFSKYFTVISEVGSKNVNVTMSDDEWIEHIKKELEAGASLVILESRESGTVGIFDSNGKPKEQLIEKIAKEIDNSKLMWETPNKEQQTWFIKKFGPNVNLGNIPREEVIALETLRLGLRADTFFDFLPEHLKS